MEKQLQSTKYAAVTSVTKKSPQWPFVFFWLLWEYKIQ